MRVQSFKKLHLLVQLKLVKLIEQASQSVKNVTMELGGLAPLIVHEDANVDLAVDQTIATKFRNAGQTCICANRIYVHESLNKSILKS